MKYVEQFTSYLKKDKTLSLLIRILPFFTVYLEYTKHINEMNFKLLFIVCSPLYHIFLFLNRNISR